MGHAEAFVMGDVVAVLATARLRRAAPDRLGSFGLNAENADIQRNIIGRVTYANIETQARSFRRYGLSVDWSRRLHTPTLSTTAGPVAVLRFGSAASRTAGGWVNWCPAIRPSWPTSRSSPGCASAAAAKSPNVS